jgi:hypothetical protein
VGSGGIYSTKYRVVKIFWHHQHQDAATRRRMGAPLFSTLSLLATFH